jgi:hypothetical protein
VPVKGMNKNIMRMNYFAIGYWHSVQEPYFCTPQSLTDETWNDQERQSVITHIRGAGVMRYCRGYSACRFCNKPNGTSDKSDGLFYFPEGLEHYLEKHWVKPPQLFIDFVNGIDVRQKLYEQAETARQTLPLRDFEDYTVDFSWWIEINKPKA